MFGYFLVPFSGEKAVVCPIVIYAKDLIDADKNGRVNELIKVSVECTEDSIKVAVDDWLKGRK